VTIESFDGSGMARDFVISGECLIRVKGSSSSAIASVSDLGLAEKEVRIIPRFIHTDVNIDDFGPEIPAEVLANLAEVMIRFTLVHFDQSVLEACISESLGGASTFGTLPGAGIPLGRGAAPFSANCHYISLNLLSQVLNKPWRFLTTYMPRNPVEYPIGTERTKADVIFRAIPYQAYNSLNQELVSKNAVLWDRNLDT
jgi:hypothetical protein